MSRRSDGLVGLGLPGTSLSSGMPLLGTVLEPTLTTTLVHMWGRVTRPWHQSPRRLSPVVPQGGHHNRPGWPVEQRDTLRWSAGQVETYALLFRHRLPNVCGTKRGTADVCRRGCMTRRSITSRGQLGGAGV